MSRLDFMSEICAADLDPDHDAAGCVGHRSLGVIGRAHLSIDGESASPLVELHVCSRCACVFIMRAPPTSDSENHHT